MFANLEIAGKIQIIKERPILRFIIYLLALVVYTFFMVGFTFYRKNVPTKPLTVKEFPRIAIKNQQGQYKTIDDFKGKTILVDFWFSTCPPCLAEMKYFPELLYRYDNLTIMSFSIDTENHTKDLLKRKPEPWGFLINDNPRWTFYNVNRKEKNGYVDLLNVTSFPTYFLINEHGEIISSPRNAIYSVEKKLGGLSSLRLTFYSYLDEYDFRIILKGFILYNLLVLTAILLLGSGSLVKKSS